MASKSYSRDYSTPRRDPYWFLRVLAWTFVIALLVGLVLSRPARAADDGAAGPLIDLALLTPDPAVGRQRDAGVAWPGSFELEDLVLVVTVRERGTDRVLYLEPEKLLRGVAAARPFLVTIPYRGWIGGVQDARQVIHAEARKRFTLAVTRAVSTAAGRLPSVYGSLAPQLVRDVVRAFAGAR